VAGGSRNSDLLLGMDLGTDISQLHDRAVRRDGILTRADLEAAGLSSGGMGRALRAGVIRRLRHGAYTTPQFLESIGEDRWARHALDVRAALSAAGGDALAASASAAALHGIDMFGVPPNLPILVRPIELNGHGRLTRTTRARMARLPEDHRTMLGEWPVTTPARTIVDIARSRDDRVVVVAGDCALRSGLGRHELDAALADGVRSPGIRRARRAIDLCDGRAESPLESLTRLAIKRAGLPMPQLQHQIGPYRVDFCWPLLRLVLEVDGRDKYQQPDDLFSEKRREDWIRSQGYAVRRAVWQDVIPSPQPLYNLLTPALPRAA
jgi:very-short-patch-repair endonuclease